MTLRELFKEYGYATPTAISAATGLNLQRVSDLLYGRDILGSGLGRRISAKTGIPVGRLIEAAPEPPAHRKA